jgi:hypothetical protein
MPCSGRRSGEEVSAAGSRGSGERGVVLLVVLLILLLVTGSSAAFIWFMNQQQTRAGVQFRSAAALSLAEAGVHRAASFLENVAPDGSPGRVWRPAAYSDALWVGALPGRFTISMADDADGAILVTSAGETGGITRRLRARIYLASPALLAAVYGRGIVHLERPPAAIVILPYGAGIGDRPWIHIAAGAGVEFASTDVSINDPSTPFVAGPGPVDAPEGSGSGTAPRSPGPVRLLLARDAALTVGQDRQRVDVQQLRVMGVHVEGVVLHAEALPTLPEIDRAYYQALAANNAANAGRNEAAGRFAGDDSLTHKPDSLYAGAEFERLMAYMQAEQPQAQLKGVVYIKGGLWLQDGRTLGVADGTLVSEGPVYLGRRATLQVTHSAATRRLPGVIVLDDSALVVAGEARLRVHGLVYATRMIDIGRDAQVDIVGAVLDDDPGLSFRSFGASAVIRYDPAVFGTPGLRVAATDPVAAWMAAWEELP